MSTSEPPDPPWLSSKRIIIVGAGISSLSFAISLSQLYPPNHPKPTLQIFERDLYESRTGREGYTLSLRTDSRSGGCQILDKLDLYDKVKSVSVGGEGNMYFWMRSFDNVLISARTKAVGPKRLTGMRIRRNALQKVLADAAVAAGWSISWGKAVNEVLRQDHGTFLVSLSGGGSAVCDILIAADGASSRVRSILKPEHGLNYAGVVAMTGTAKFDKVDDVPVPVRTSWGLILGGGGTSGFAAPVDEMSALWSLSYLSDTPRDKLKMPLSRRMFNELCVEAHGRTKLFDSDYHTLIDHTDPTTLQVLNAIDRPPFGHSPAVDGPVVFIGDSNHAVSPFAGNGANMALIDGWDLAGCLCSARSLEDALMGYDKKFMPRSAATLRFSRWSISIAHSTGWRLWLYTFFTKVMRFVFVSAKDIKPHRELE